MTRMDRLPAHRLSGLPAIDFYVSNHTGFLRNTKAGAWKAILEKGYADKGKSYNIGLYQ
ncbi:hypothetical protein M2105_004447 [Paenibacillus sp. PastF-1]|uniref:hypothetical protein n=2 Tax=Paenibacillus TaxID=44249 RepID=UPI002406FC6D|nr:hypothetical protein [Paenibacillus sp. PastF-1]MDF9856574.1 hypothetical protein [Paenibacillus sp. PastF-1]